MNALEPAMTAAVLAEPCQHPLAIFRPGDFSRTPAVPVIPAAHQADELAVVLPAEAVPAAMDAGCHSQVELQAGVLRWRGANGTQHQLGSTAVPLQYELQRALLRQDGLLVLFMDTLTGQLHQGGVFHA